MDSKIKKIKNFGYFEISQKVASILLRLGISVLILILLFYQVDTKKVLEILKETNKPFLFLAFVVYFFTYLLCLLRWEMLLKALKVHLSLKRITVSFAGGVFFSLFLPSTIGGDLVRSIDLATHTKRPREVIATVFLDRLSGYIGLAILASLAIVFGRKLIEDKSVLLSLGIIILILVVLLFVLFNRFLYSFINRLLHSPTAGKFRETIKNIHQEIHYFKHHKKVIINNLIMSFFIQAIVPLTFYIIALSLGIKLNPTYFFVFLPIIGAITLLPISIGGLGLRDASTIFFFAKVGVSKDLAFAMSFLNFLFIGIYAGIGGLIYVLTIHHRRIQRHQPHSLRSTHP